MVSRGCLPLLLGAPAQARGSATAPPPCSLPSQPPTTSSGRTPTLPLAHRPASGRRARPRRSRGGARPSGSLAPCSSSSLAARLSSSCA
ncbi:hypothetical protein VHUM_01660 [Vanrija humicola]|uniref:Uncharacterized protein n=1 Tax=Vanrija humicola TaxID=5417 RepID=A0A7D8V1J3_VANHU|nr:hypothetical protein VHUM_01660 [Vanrija humicola]